MFSQQKTDSVTRSVSSLTLDGRKLTADVSILLHRAMGRSDAEALATQVAGIVDDILSGQIIQGQAPLSASDLEAMTLAKAKGLAKVGKVRITSLRLSVPAQGPVPSVRPAPTRPPDHQRGSSPSPEAQSGTRLGVGTGTPSRTPSPPPSMSPPSANPRRSPSPAPSVATRSSVPPRSAPAAHSGSAPPRSAAPAASSSVPPRSHSQAPASLAPMDVAAFGAALKLPLRDTAARAVISVLSVVTSAAIDRLSLLRGNAPAGEVCREVCACFAASIYRSCVARGETHRLAAAKVEAVCKQAFSDGTSPSATEIGFYIASEVPAAELATRIAGYLDCPDDVHLLRAAVTSCHTAFSERLVRLSGSG